LISVEVFLVSSRELMSSVFCRIVFGSASDSC
jgi:hypothetical protein